MVSCQHLRSNNNNNKKNEKVNFCKMNIFQKYFPSSNIKNSFIHSSKNVLRKIERFRHGIRLGSGRSICVFFSFSPGVVFVFATVVSHPPPPPPRHHPKKKKKKKWRKRPVVSRRTLQCQPKIIFETSNKQQIEWLHEYKTPAVIPSLFRDINHTKYTQSD
jgi:hypothetical protein